MSERFGASGAYPDGQFYVFDKCSSGIINPDSGKCNSPWRKMYTREDAEKAAAWLNKLETDYAMQALICAAWEARVSEDRLT